MKNALLIFLFVFTSNAVASTITLDATNSGWYSSDFTNNGKTSNMFAGDEFGSNYRNWLAFDLSSVTDTILSASLDIANDGQNDTGITFTWSEVTTLVPSLGSPASALTNFNIYNDLGNGTIYSSGITTAGTIDHYVFNANALISLNSTGSLWAIGGSTANDMGMAYGFTSGVASLDFIKLTLEIADPISEVPVPAAAWLFGSGLFAILGFSRRKKV